MLLSIQLLQGTLTDQMFHISAGQVVRGAQIELNTSAVLGGYPAQTRSDDPNLNQIFLRRRQIGVQIQINRRAVPRYQPIVLGEEVHLGLREEGSDVRR